MPELRRGYLAHKPQTLPDRDKQEWLAIARAKPGPTLVSSLEPDLDPAIFSARRLCESEPAQLTGSRDRQNARGSFIPAGASTRHPSFDNALARGPVRPEVVRRKHAPEPRRRQCLSVQACGQDSSLGESGGRICRGMSRAGRRSLTQVNYFHGQEEWRVEDLQNVVGQRGPSPFDRMPN